MSSLGLGPLTPQADNSPAPAPAEKAKKGCFIQKREKQDSVTCKGLQARDPMVLKIAVTWPRGLGDPSKTFHTFQESEHTSYKKV